MLFELLSKYRQGDDLIELANSQGVAGLLFDEYEETLNSEGRKILDRKDALKLSVAIDYYRKVYKKQLISVARLSEFYSRNGISMMLLKGYGLSFDWPKPDSRPCGDIDIFLFEGREEAWKRGDELVASKLGVKIDTEHEHHTGFKIEGVDVENHYDFINVKGHRDAPFIEKKLKELAFRPYREVRVAMLKDAEGNSPKLVLPSSDFNALFLLRHMGQHFAGSEMLLRQVMDWGYFIDRHTDEVHWDELIPFFHEIGLDTFFHQVNAICVDYLGFEESRFPKINRQPDLEQRILNDIFTPEFTEKIPQNNLLKIILFKNRRYWANSWKRKLIFKDSPLVDFFYGSFAHIMKWGSIKESC